MYDKIITDINKESNSFYKNKLSSKEIYNYLTKKSEEKLEFYNSEEKKNNEIIYDIKKFMSLLRDDNEIILNLFSENIKEKEKISSFIIDYFYDNPYSQETESNFLLLIWNLLKNDIFKYFNKKEVANFFKQTLSGCILKKLFLRKEIKVNFKKIFHKVIQTIQFKSYREWDLRINSIDKKISKKIYIINKGPQLLKREKKIIYLNNIDLSYMDFLQEINLEKLYNKNNNDKEKGFLKKQMNYIKKKNKENNANLFSNKPLLTEIFQKDKPYEIIEEYISILKDIIYILNLFFDTLLNNISIIPQYLISICIMLSILLIKQSPYISSISLFEFIGYFIFIIVVKPFFTQSEFEGISEDYITKETKHNIKCIFDILLSMINNKLYTNDKYKENIPLNKIIVENVSKKCFLFIEKLVNIPLPESLDNIINEDKSENNNPYSSFCFSIQDFYILFHKIVTNENIIKILNNKNLPNNLLKRRNLFISLLHKISSEQYLSFIENLIKNNKKNQKKSIFITNNIELLRIPQTKEYFMKNNNDIINLISSILFSIESLNQISFPKGNNDNLISFINNLFYHVKNRIYFKTNYKSIYLNLYNLKEQINSLSNEEIEHLDKELNNFKDEIYDSIEKYKINKISKLKEAYTSILINRKLMESYNKHLIEYKELFLSQRILNDITSDNIRSNKSPLTPQNNKNEQTYNIILNHIIKFKDIINELPDYKFMNQDISVIIEENKLSQTLNYLIKALKDLMKLFIKENDNSKSLNNIISYLMNLIYNKIFPEEETEEDKKFEENCQKNSGIKLNDLISNINNILNDDFLEEGFCYIQNLEIEKCAFRKFKLFINFDNFIHKIVNQYIKSFSNEDIINLKMYIIIKSKPKLFISNIKYIQGFILKNEITLGEKEVLSEIEILKNKCISFFFPDENLITENNI